MLRYAFARRFGGVLRAVCAVLAVCFLALSLCACGKKPGSSEIQPATELPADMDGTVNPTDAQSERILELAAAFRQFGSYGEESLTFSKLEHIVFCMFTDSPELESSDREGFGKVPQDKADSAIKGVFGDIEIKDVMRRKYDPAEDQTYYYSNGYYYLMRTDNSAYTYDLKSVKAYTGDDGKLYHAAVVTVSRSGKAEMDLVFSLVPDNEYVYRVSACDISMWS